MTDEQVLTLCHPIEGWMYDNELLWLHQQALTRRTILEIGVWQGRSTTALASATPGTVYAVDHWQGSPEERGTYHKVLTTKEGSEQTYHMAYTNLRQFIQTDKCRLLRCDSEDMITLLEFFRPQTIDMLFLDGGHDFRSVTQNLKQLIPLVKPDGLVCGHDRFWPGVSQALQDFFGLLSPQPSKVLDGPGSIWYIDP